MKGFWSRGLLSILILSLVLAVIFSLSACGSTDLKTTPAPTPTPMPTPTPTPEAEFEVVSLDIMPPEVVIGEEVTITAKAANTGKCEGTYTAVLMINGVEVERKDVTVSPEADELVSFKISKDAEGTYAVKVAQLSKTLVVRKLPAKLEDSTNDLFNKAGEPTTSEPYLDIIETELSLCNG